MGAAIFYVGGCVCLFEVESKVLVGTAAGDHYVYLHRFAAAVPLWFTSVRMNTNCTMSSSLNLRLNWSEYQLPR